MHIIAVTCKTSQINTFPLFGYPDLTPSAMLCCTIERSGITLFCKRGINQQDADAGRSTTRVFINAKSPSTTALIKCYMFIYRYSASVIRRSLLRDEPCYLILCGTLWCGQSPPPFSAKSLTRTATPRRSGLSVLIQRTDHTIQTFSMILS